MRSGEEAEDIVAYLRRLVRVLEQNDVAVDSVFQDHATLIDDVTP